MAKDGNVIKMGKIAAYKDPIILREYERLRRLAFPAWFKEHRKHWKRIPLTAHVIAYRKQWAKNNPEKRKKYWQKDNAKPERKNYQRKWHHANRTRRRIRARELRLANPAAAKAKCARIANIEGDDLVALALEVMGTAREAPADFVLDVAQALAWTHA